MLYLRITTLSRTAESLRQLKPRYSCPDDDTQVSPTKQSKKRKCEGSPKHTDLPASQHADPDFSIVEITIKGNMFIYLIQNGLLLKVDTMFDCYLAKGTWPENAGTLKMYPMQQYIESGLDITSELIVQTEKQNQEKYHRYRILAKELLAHNKSSELDCAMKKAVRLTDAVTSYITTMV